MTSSVSQSIAGTLARAGVSPRRIGIVVGVLVVLGLFARIVYVLGEMVLPVRHQGQIVFILPAA